MIKVTSIVVIVMLMIVSGFVLLYYNNYDSDIKILNDYYYSEPTYDDGHKIEWDKSVSEKPIKEDITKEEWNDLFEDYRNGEISKEDAVEIIRSVEIKW